MKLQTGSAVAVFLQVVTVERDGETSRELRCVQVAEAANDRGYWALPEVERFRLAPGANVPALAVGQLVELRGLQQDQWRTKDGTRSGSIWSASEVVVASANGVGRPVSAALGAK